MDCGATEWRRHDDDHIPILNARRWDPVKQCRRLMGVAMVIAAALSASCYAMLDWDPNNQPCTDNQCLDGYTCLGGQRCVKNRSIALGQSCTRLEQCVDSSVCFQNICRKPCSAYYAPSTDCPDHFYCQPHKESSATDFTFSGGCVPSECSVGTDSDCTGCGEVCVPITSTANACLPGCDINSFTNAGAALDTCHASSCSGSDCGIASSLNYCQPLGYDAATQRLVYLETKALPQQAGEQCGVVDNPCRRGFACVPGDTADRVCEKYCNLHPGAGQSSGCGAGTTCCTHTNASQTYGLCQTTCN